VMMMLVVSTDRLMGRFKARPWLIAFGWLGTLLMALAVVGLFGSYLLG
jgi:Mn2+/Fe2+ NRAMP family transporter